MPVHDLPLPELHAALAGLGVSLPEPATTQATLARAAALPADAEDLVEMFFSRLRAARIELHAEPALLHSFFGGFVPEKPLPLDADEIPQAVRDIFRMVVCAVYDDFGIVPPPVVWIADAALPARTLAVKINDARSAPLTVIAEDQLLVNTAPGELAALGLEVGAMLNPATGATAAVVAATLQEAFVKAGLTFWTPPGFAALVLFGEVRRHLPRLLGLEDVEYLLSQLAPSAPELVAAACERFRPGEITRVLRGLLGEGVSIRNLRAILDRLLQFDTLAVDSLDEFVFDDRLPILAGAGLPAPPPWRQLREFVRAGLKEQLTFACGRGQPTLPVILLEAALKARVFAAALDEAEVRAFVASVRAFQEQNPPPCALLATPLTRAACRELLAHDLPQFPVLAFSELTPDASLQVLGHATAAPR